MRPATHSFPDLHSLAADVQNDLSALATGLAHAGAAPQIVQRLSQMSGTISDVTKILASAPPIPNPAHAAPTSTPAPTQQSGGSSQPAQQRPAANDPHKALGQAVAALHTGMQAQAMSAGQ